MINGSKVMENNLNSDTFESNFEKKLTFRQLYDILKRNKQYIFNKKIPQWSCLCEICENAVFLVKGLNKKLFPECRLPETVNELVAKFSCSDAADCMTSQCDECSSTQIETNHFNAELVLDADSSADDSSDNENEVDRTNDSVSFFEWARAEDNKRMKMMFHKSFEESICLLDTTIISLKRHIFVKRVQYKHYVDFKNNIGKNDIFVHVDYSESYENKQQREIQSAYFGHTTIPDHSRAAAITCVLKEIENIQEIHRHLPLKINAMVLSDGCAAQFRSRFVFKLLAGIDSSLNLTWCYNERHHGKGPMDGIGGTLKNCVYRDVMSGKCVIDTPKQFAEHADKSIKGITSLYLPSDEVMTEPDGMDLSPKIPETLKIHMIKCLFDHQKVSYIEFYKTASDPEPYFTQFYGEVACGHPKHGTDDNHCGGCLEEYVPGEERLQCPICNIWFQKECFYE